MPVSSPDRPTGGYVLLEAMIGGALVAVVLGALYVQAGFAHVKIVEAARRTTATHVAQVGLERELAFGFVNAASRPAETVNSGGAQYTRTVFVAVPDDLGGVRFRDVVVDVRYNVAGTDRLVRASSRVWEP